MKQDFIHLRLYSAYSLANGAIKIKRIPDLCKSENMPAVAITDKNGMFGALEFSSMCSKNGIQPIVGTCLTLFKNVNTNLLGQKNKETFEILLLAQTEIGYKNLMKLSSKSFFENDNNGYPELDLNKLAEYSDGIIALSGGIKGLIGKPTKEGNRKDAEDNLKFLLNIFGDRLYIEVIRDPIESAVENYTLELAYKYNVPIVATNHVYFESPDMYEAHDALLCIAQGTFISEIDRERSNLNYYFKSQDEMIELFEDLPEAIENTVLIAKRCSFMPKEHAPVLPRITTGSERSDDEQLVFQAHEGLKIRMRQNGIVDEQSIKEYTERLEYELDVILKMGFSSYFLIVSDFICYAKENGIAVGPGRGSGAGSLVAYCIKITNVDPIRFNLIFERFLNPERVSMPDFDTDFCQERRDEVIEYLCEKYGRNRVAHIITFGTLQARAAIRDVGRVLGLPYGLVDKTSKLVPNNPTKPLTLQQAIEVEPALSEAMRADTQIRKLINIALKLEGLYRHASTHAAGIVISNGDVDNIVPLYKDPKSDVPVTQFNMKMVEKAGLVKFDFLGLKTLTTIQKTCELIKSRGVPIDIDMIPLDEEGTFQMIRRLETVGIFQLESNGMRSATKLLQPDRFEDIISLISLYRPGPMDDIPVYAARKHGQEEIVYAHPIIKNILEPTYGVMVYQEQVMQIAQVLAGYTMGQADLLRRAMGKKIASEMAAHRERFITGAKQHGMTEINAGVLFDQIAKFAGYGFNKSHATPYALISYQTAYLKHNYPVEFMTETMNLDRSNVSKLSFFRNELIRLGIKLLPPDIQKSDVLFSVEECDGELAIRYGLGAIKGTSEQAMLQIEKSRASQGDFKNLTDFLLRFDTQVVNKKQLESLICAGAFDSINTNRHQLFEHVVSMVKFKNNSDIEQRSLFDTDFRVFVLDQVENWTLLETLEKELEVIGFYLSDHPLSRYVTALEHLGVTLYSDLYDSLETESALLSGIVLKIVKKISKTGKQFIFIHISDTSGMFEVVAFSEVMNKYRDLLVVGKMLLIKCFIKHDGEMMRITASEIREFNGEEEIVIKIRSAEHLQKIYNLINQLEFGDMKIVLLINERKIILDKCYRVTDRDRHILGSL